MPAPFRHQTDFIETIITSRLATTRFVGARLEITSNDEELRSIGSVDYGISTGKNRRKS